MEEEKKNKRDLNFYIYKKKYCFTTDEYFDNKQKKIQRHVKIKIKSNQQGHLQMNALIDTTSQ